MNGRGVRKANIADNNWIKSTSNKLPQLRVVQWRAGVRVVCLLSHEATSNVTSVTDNTVTCVSCVMLL